MKVFVSFLFLFLSFILQSTLFAQFSIGGIIPNIMIIVVISCGFLGGRKLGLTIGFIGGLFADIFYGSILGIYALIYMYIGFFGGQCRRILFAGDLKLPLLLIGFSDLVYGHICYFFMFLLKGEFHYFFYLVRVIIPEILYTIVLALVVYPLMDIIFRNLDRREKQLEGDEEIA